MAHQVSERTLSGNAINTDALGCQCEFLECAKSTRSRESLSVVIGGILDIGFADSMLQLRPPAARRPRLTAEQCRRSVRRPARLVSALRDSERRRSGCALHGFMAPFRSERGANLTVKMRRIPSVYCPGTRSKCGELISVGGRDFAASSKFMPWCSSWCDLSVDQPRAPSNSGSLTRYLTS